MDISLISNSFMVLLTSFISSGGIGFVNYYILSELGWLNIPETKKDEKRVAILFFSVINFMIFLVFCYTFSNEQSISFLKLSLSIIVTAVISIIFSFKAYPKVVEKILNRINKERLDNEKTVNSSLSPRSEAFDNSSTQEIFVFPLENSINENSVIVHGYLHHWSDSEEYKNEFSIIPAKYEKYFFTENETIQYLERAEAKNYDTEIFIDTEAKLKYFIVFY